MRDWLALLRAPGIGPRTYRELLRLHEHPRAVLAAGERAWSAAGLAAETRAYLQQPDWACVDTDLAWADLPGRHLLTCDDPRYPTRLATLTDAPPVLFVHGRIEVLNALQLALVGSRNPTPGGRETAYQFARHLACTGLIITSGLALGIDAAAHQGALDAGGLTVAVAATGLDRVYPASHRELAHVITEHGALVSEFSCGTPPLPGHFPRRNRIISGLALGVLVVEATLHSGSLVTARHAAEQGREVFAIPGSIHNAQARGCHALIRQGAKLVESMQDILEELGALPAPTAPSSATPPPPTDAVVVAPDYLALLQQLAFGPITIDALVERAGLTPEAVSSMLLLMELQGYVSAMSGGLYGRTALAPTHAAVESIPTS